MPELPEVEVIRKGITPYILNQHINKIMVYTLKLRWPVSLQITSILPGKRVNMIERRSKYLFLRFNVGTLIIHLGMSGRLQTLFGKVTPEKHDHMDIEFNNGYCLRYTDPRRLGCILWTNTKVIEEHKLIKNLGPEPFDKNFNIKYLTSLAMKRSIPVKMFILNSKIVAGIGNIYANESLFEAKINPIVPAKKVDQKLYIELIKYIKIILRKSIKQGGTSFKNFVDNNGKKGRFKQHLKVYGRAGKECLYCNTIIQKIIIGQRSTYFCPICQK